MGLNLTVTFLCLLYMIHMITYYHETLDECSNYKKTHYIFSQYCKFFRFKWRQKGTVILCYIWTSVKNILVGFQGLGFLYAETIGYFILLYFFFITLILIFKMSFKFFFILIEFYLILFIKN